MLNTAKYRPLINWILPLNRLPDYTAAQWLNHQSYQLFNFGGKVFFSVQIPLALRDVTPRLNIVIYSYFCLSIQHNQNKMDESMFFHLRTMWTFKRGDFYRRTVVCTKWVMPSRWLGSVSIQRALQSVSIKLRSRSRTAQDLITQQSYCSCWSSTCWFDGSLSSSCSYVMVPSTVGLATAAW